MNAAASGQHQPFNATVNGKWRAIDVRAQVPTRSGQPSIGQALRGIAGVGGKEGAEIRAALSGGSGAAGGYTLPDEMFDQIVTLTSQQQTLVRAGARVVEVLHDDLTIPRVLSGPIPAWRLENAALAESDPTFEAAKLTPRSLAVLVKVSRELLEDGFEIEQALTTTMVNAVAEAIEAGILRGSGTAPQMLGLLNRALIGFPGEVETPLDGWAPLLNAAWTLKGFKYPTEPNALIVGGALAAIMDGTTGADGQLLGMPKVLADMPRYVSNAMQPAVGDPANCYAAAFGDFTQMLIGWKGGIRVEVLRERYAENHQVSFVVHARVGMELMSTWAFKVLRRIKGPTYVF